MRAFDAVTGKPLWTFHTIPQPGEPNFGTSWVGDSWKGFSGVNVWGWYMTVDEKRGILYMPLGEPRRQLLRRRPSRRESVRQFAGRCGRQHRQVSVAFPDRPSRFVGFGSASRRRAWSTS